MEADVSRAPLRSRDRLVAPGGHSRRQLPIGAGYRTKCPMVERKITLTDSRSRRQQDHARGELLYSQIGPAADRQGENPHRVVRQMTERRQKLAGRRHAEIQRMEAAMRFQSLLEQLPGMPYVASLEKNGRMMYVSPKIEELLGFTPDQWRDDPGLRIRQLHEADRARVQQAVAAAVANNGAYRIDYRIFDSEGRLHWFHDEASVTLDDRGCPAFLQGVALDITERKQAQLDLERSHAELQELIAALDASRGEEQRRLAQEMHDDFGQLLTAMKMDLCTLRQCLPQDDTQVVAHLTSINELVEAMVASVRRIVADLPPKILEDLGLYSALESMTGNFTRRHGIACRLHVPQAEPALDARVALAVYRLVQEALNNVAKHAHARCAEVRIECDGDGMTVYVGDDGNGLTMNNLNKPGSFGLRGMRERVAAFGGKLRIDSAEGKGTQILIRLPLATIRKN